MAALVHDRPDTTKGHEQEGRDEVWPSALRPDVSRATEGEGAGGWVQAVLAVVAIIIVLALGGSLADAAERIGGTSGPVGVGRPPEAPALGAPALASSSVGDVVRVIQPGQTYWSIAEELGGPSDIRARVAVLEEANGGRALRAGDRLVIPELE